MATIIEVQTLLQKLTNKKITYTLMGKVWGTQRATVSARANNNSQVTERELKLLEDFFNVPLIETLNKNTPELLIEDNIILDYYPDVCGSCGNGVFQFSTHKEQIIAPKSAFCTRFQPHKQYFIIHAVGDSMQPLIYDKDKLLIEHWEGEQIIDNRPYLFCRNDEIYIKRLAKNVDQLLIIPENKDYDITKLYGEEMNQVDIIGQVVGLMRDLR